MAEQARQRAAQATTSSFTVSSTATSRVTFSGPAQQPQPAQGQLQEQYEDDEPISPAPPAPKQQPIRAERLPDRNAHVNVQYYDGRIERDVKFKKVEADVMAGRAVLID